jgi:hypothetical protein
MFIFDRIEGIPWGLEESDLRNGRANADHQTESGAQSRSSVSSISGCQSLSRHACMHAILSFGTQVRSNIEHVLPNVYF